MAYLTDEMFAFGPSEQRLRYPSVLGRATFCLKLVIIIIVTFCLENQTQTTFQLNTFCFTCIYVFCIFPKRSRHFSGDLTRFAYVILYGVFPIYHSLGCERELFGKFC